MNQKEQIRLDETIFCKANHENIPIEKCVDQYVDANAFGIRESACYKCPQGHRIRSILARS